MSEVNVYTFELLNQTYKVRSNENAEMVQSVFKRLQDEVDSVATDRYNVSARDGLVIAALNLAQRVLTLEENNQELMELLNYK